MNTLLLRPYEYLRMHVHPATAAERVKPRSSHLRELLSFAERAGKIALLIGMAVPILHGERAIGVAQISRKGDTPSQAGPDFTPHDVARAQDFFGQVGGYLAAARPPKF